MRTYSNSIVIKFDTVTNGNAGAGKFVSVFDVGTTDEVDLFNASLSPINNPVQADDDGNYTFTVDDGTYDLYIDYGLPTQTAILNEQISNIVDNPPLSPNDNVIAFDEVNDAVTETNTLKMFEGAALNLKERTTGNGGGAMWDVVLASTVTPNTFNIVQCTGVPTLALVLRTVLIINADQFGAIGDGVTTGQELPIQAALDYAASSSNATQKNKVMLTAGGRYLTDATIAIPRSITLDTTGTEIFCSAVTIFTMGSAATLIGRDAEYSTSGQSGSAIMRDNQTAAAQMNIIGWPQMTATAKRISGSIGFDALAGRTSNFEVAAVDYDIGIRSGGLPAPSTSYYMSMMHPTTKGCVTGILIDERSNGWTIYHPQISGGDFSRTGIHMRTAVNGVITGGYVEAFEDNINSRGLLFDGATNITVINTALEAATTVANFAIGMINNASDLNFINTRPGAGWNSGGKTLTNSGTGIFSWSGLNPFSKQQINLLAVRQFLGTETQGMYKASNDQGGLDSSVKFQGFKVGTSLANGQTIVALEAFHEDATDPGKSGVLKFVTDGGTSADTALVIETGNASSLTERFRIGSAGEAKFLGAFSLTGIPVFADEAAAASLSTGSLYRTATGELRIKL